MTAASRPRSFAGPVAGARWCSLGAASSNTRGPPDSSLRLRLVHVGRLKAVPRGGPTYSDAEARPAPMSGEFLEAAGAGYTIRLPANQVLQNKIEYLLKRPVGRPPHEVRRYYASFLYQAQSWNKPRQVVAKVEWHPGELYPLKASSKAMDKPVICDDRVRPLQGGEQLLKLRFYQTDCRRRSGSVEGDVVASFFSGLRI
jgi:hypothetical protein